MKGGYIIIFIGSIASRNISAKPHKLNQDFNKREGRYDM